MTLPAAGATKRIVSYNVHACIGRDGRFRPQRILEVLEPLDADFIALQEVEDRAFGDGMVSEYFATGLGMHLCAGFTLRRGDVEYGNILLSRLKPERHRLHDLSVSGREPRGAIEAHFSLDESHLLLVVTHLGLTAAERTRQVRRLLPEIAQHGADITVLAGDVNEWRPAAAARRRLARVFGRVPRRRTFPARRPVFALDQIYVSPPALLEDVRAVGTTLAREASDHLPLAADIALPRGQV